MSNRPERVAQLMRREIAEVLDIPEGTVKSAASRGLDQLRMLLSAEYEDKRVRRVHPR